MVRKEAAAVSPGYSAALVAILLALVPRQMVQLVGQHTAVALVFVPQPVR